MLPVVAAPTPCLLLVPLVLIPHVHLTLLLVNVIAYHHISRPMPVVVPVALLLVKLVREPKRLVSHVFLDLVYLLAVSVPFQVAGRTVRPVVHPILEIRVLLV